MTKDIKQRCESCTTCQQQKITRHTKKPWQELPHPSARFTTVHLDIVGPFPTSRNYDTDAIPYRYVLTMVDRFTRWIEAVPLSGITASEVAQAFISGWISRWGVPLEVITDRGKQFDCSLFTELSRTLGFIKLRTTAYHPQSNGLVERPHRTLKTILRSHEHDWMETLPIALLALRTSPSSITKQAPFTMVTGTSLLIPRALIQRTTLQDDPVTFTCTLAKHMSELCFSPPQWNQSHQGKTYIPKNLENCEKVWVRVDRVRNPLEAPYTGPFDVIKRTPNYFRIKYPSGREDNVSINRLKPFVPYCPPVSQPRRYNRTIRDFPEVDVEDDELPYMTGENNEIDTTSCHTENVRQAQNGSQANSLSNAEKFKQRLPFTSRYGRHIKFSNVHQVHYF